MLPKNKNSVFNPQSFTYDLSGFTRDLMNLDSEEMSNLASTNETEGKKKKKRRKNKKKKKKKEGEEEAAGA